MNIYILVSRCFIQNNLQLIKQTASQNEWNYSLTQGLEPITFWSWAQSLNTPSWTLPQNILLRPFRFSIDVPVTQSLPLALCYTLFQSLSMYALACFCAFSRVPCHQGDETALQKLSSCRRAFSEADGDGWIPLHAAAVQSKKTILEITFAGLYSPIGHAGSVLHTCGPGCCCEVTWIAKWTTDISFLCCCHYFTWQIAGRATGWPCGSVVQSALSMICRSLVQISGDRRVTSEVGHLPPIASGSRWCWSFSK